MIYDNFVKWLDGLDLSTVDANPISFKLTDFETVEDFAKSMFLAGRHLHNEEEIVVRYSKPYTEDKKDVIVQFQILRSKAKMFFNYLRWNDASFRCFLTSNKEIKEAIKFFNSLGVKGDGMERMASKENDYASMLKGELEAYNKRMEEIGNDGADSIVITISLGHDDNEDIDYPMLSYDFINCNGCHNFNDTKEWVKREILKIN